MRGQTAAAQCDCPGVVSYALGHHRNSSDVASGNSERRWSRGSSEVRRSDNLRKRACGAGSGVGGRESAGAGRKWGRGDCSEGAGLVGGPQDAVVQGSGVQDRCAIREINRAWGQSVGRTAGVTSAVRVIEDPGSY